MVDIRKMVDELFKNGQNQGMGDMEAYITESDSFEVRVYQGEIDGYKSSLSHGLGFRGFYKNKIGYSYTEKLSNDSIDILVRHAKENAALNDSEDDDIIFEGSKDYQKVCQYNPDLERVTEKQKIEFCRELERVALKIDSRIKTCQYCVMGTEKEGQSLFNTKGLSLYETGNQGYAYVMLLSRDDAGVSSGFDYIISNDFSKYDAEQLAQKAAEKSLAFLQAKSMKSGEYPVIINNESMAGLLGNLSGIFSARAVQKKLSLLKGKISEKIAADCITIADDPFLIGGGNTRTFDAEGVASLYKRVIDKGVLTTYLHNLKSARKDGTVSTGNASRGSYKGTIEIAPSNMYIEKGNITLSALLSQMKNGVYITDLEGMHAGINTISGDFSLSAKGFIVEDGVKTRPVNQITVSGNFYSLLKNAVALGDDFKLDMNASIGSPSVFFSGLSISGE